MFCWPCIYEWTDAKKGSASCPVCKNPIKDLKNDSIPIFTKEETSQNTKRFVKVPKRPKGERNGTANASGSSRFNFNGGVGFFPFFGFNINYSSSNTHGAESYTQEHSPFEFLNQFSSLPSHFKQSLIHLFIVVFLLFFFSNWKVSVFE